MKVLRKNLIALLLIMMGGSTTIFGMQEDENLFSWVEDSHAKNRLNEMHVAQNVAYHNIATSAHDYRKCAETVEVDCSKYLLAWDDANNEYMQASTQFKREYEEQDAFWYKRWKQKAHERELYATRERFLGKTLLSLFVAPYVCQGLECAYYLGKYSFKKMQSNRKKKELKKRQTMEQATPKIMADLSSTLGINQQTLRDLLPIADYCFPGKYDLVTQRLQLDKEAEQAAAALESQSVDTVVDNQLWPLVILGRRLRWGSTAFKVCFGSACAGLVGYMVDSIRRNKPKDASNALYAGGFILAGSPIVYMMHRQYQKMAAALTKESLTQRFLQGF